MDCGIAGSTWAPPSSSWPPSHSQAAPLRRPRSRSAVCRYTRVARDGPTETAMAAPTAAPDEPSSLPAEAAAPETPPVKSPEPAATEGADSQEADVTATARLRVAAPAPRTPALKLLVEASRPLYLTHAGDGTGRLFIVEKRGAIRIMQSGALLDGSFLDIQDRVNSGQLRTGPPRSRVSTGLRRDRLLLRELHQCLRRHGDLRFSVSEDPIWRILERVQGPRAGPAGAQP